MVGLIAGGIATTKGGSLAKDPSLSLETTHSDCALRTPSSSKILQFTILTLRCHFSFKIRPETRSMNHACTADDGMSLGQDAYNNIMHPVQLHVISSKRMGNPDGVYSTAQG